MVLLVSGCLFLAYLGYWSVCDSSMGQALGEVKFHDDERLPGPACMEMNVTLTSYSVSTFDA